MLNISTRSFHSMRSCGRVPLPIKLERSVRWEKQEIIEWTNQGCPALNKWKYLKQHLNK